MFIPSAHFQLKIDELKPLYDDLFNSCKMYKALADDSSLRPTAFGFIMRAINRIRFFRKTNEYFTYDMDHEIKQLNYSKAVKEFALFLLKTVEHFDEIK
jgi:hypothetical protein